MIRGWLREQPPLLKVRSGGTRGQERRALKWQGKLIKVTGRSNY